MEMMTKKEEYKFIGQIKRKAIERKRITEDEIETLIEICWEHGYNACITGIREYEKFHKNEN